MFEVTQWLAGLAEVRHVNLMQHHLFEGMSGSLRDTEHVVVLRVGVGWACACWPFVHVLAQRAFAFSWWHVVKDPHQLPNAYALLNAPGKTTANRPLRTEFVRWT